jgi:hypothetical protein
MSFRLHTLLGLRRRQDEQAAAEVVARARERSRADAAQTRLDDTAETARARVAAARVSQSRSLLLSGTAAQAQAAERLTMRLGDHARRAGQAAADHRKATLAAAAAAEAAARLTHRQRQQAREAVERVQARADAESRRLADRRAEDAASDLRRQRS